MYAKRMQNICNNFARAYAKMLRAHMQNVCKTTASVKIPDIPDCQIPGWSDVQISIRNLAQPKTTASFCILSFRVYFFSVSILIALCLFFASIFFAPCLFFVFVVSIHVYLCLSVSICVYPCPFWAACLSCLSLPLLAVCSPCTLELDQASPTLWAYCCRPCAAFWAGRRNQKANFLISVDCKTPGKSNCLISIDCKT